MKSLLPIALPIVLVLLLSGIPFAVIRTTHAASNSVTYNMDATGYGGYECYTLTTGTPTTNVDISPWAYFCTNFGLSTQKVNSVSVTLNYYTASDGFQPAQTGVTVELGDDSTDSLLAATPDGATITSGGSTCSPLTTTMTLDVVPGAHINSGNLIELDVYFSGSLVIGNGSCDPSAFSSVTINFQSQAPPVTSNSCDFVPNCHTSFVVFNATHAGTPLGGVNVVLTANGQASQSSTTISSASTSPLCTFDPAWTAEWGMNWGCFAGETGQFTVIVGVTYSYTATLPSGGTLTGSVVVTNPWTVLIVNLAA